MKKIITALLALVLIFTVAGCTSDSTSSDNNAAVNKNETTAEPTTVCNHEWNEATCDTAKTCSICGTVEGTKLEHAWKEADCSEPKKCTLCGITEGDAKGHSWKAANCESAKKCSNCGKTEGKANGHSYTNGVCTVCGKSNPRWGEVRDALVKCERYATYLDLEADILDTRIELYRTTGDARYLLDIQDSVENIDSYFRRIREYTAPYDELYMLYTFCDYDMPIFSSGSLAKVATYATAASRAKEIYDMHCDNYGL